MSDSAPTILSFFVRSPEEEARLQQSSFFSVSAEIWTESMKLFHDFILTGYAAGEMDFKRMMEVMLSCTIGCTPHVRLQFLALTAVKAIKVKPKYLGNRKPDFPAWHRKVAAELVQLLEQQGALNISPSASRGDQDNYCIQALKQLQVLGLDCGPISPLTGKRKSLHPRTLYKWVLEHKKLLRLSDSQDPNASDT